MINHPHHRLMMIGDVWSFPRASLFRRCSHNSVLIPNCQKNERLIFVRGGTASSGQYFVNGTIILWYTWYHTIWYHTPNNIVGRYDSYVRTPFKV